MTKHTERLMSRASVAAMAAFAPKDEKASTLPAFAERVPDDPGPDSGEGADSFDGLSAEEQAQFDAAKSGREPAAADDAGDADGGDADADGADADGDAPADRDPVARDAPADGQPAAPKTISYHKHQRELAKAQKTATDLQALLDGARGETQKEREARTRLDERTKLLLEAIQAKPAPAAAPVEDADPEPDADEDFVAHAAWTSRELKRTQKIITDMQAGGQRRDEQSAAQNEEQAIYTAFASDLERAAQADPEMSDAFVHLRETRYRELGFIYAGIDINNPDECATLAPADQAALSQNIQRSFHNEQMMVARQAIQAGRPPSQIVKNLARARGFVPKAADDPPAGGRAAAAAAAAAPGARAAPGGAPPARRSVTDDLAAIREGQAASRSLSDAGGSPGGTITPERLADMPEEEFQELYDSIPKRTLDRLMGKTG